MLSTVSMRASMMSATRFGRMASARAFSASTSSQASQGRRVGMGMAAMGAVGLFGVAASASQTQTEQAKEESKAALSPKEFRSFKVHSVESLSHNTKFLRFELPSDNHEAGLSVASCLMARAEVDGKAVMRPYTPVSTRDQKGFLDLIVKEYPEPGGVMSRHICSLKPGDELEMKGPFPKIAYKKNMVKKIGMVAGGTGITPMLQVIREALSDPEDQTEISLIFANVSEKDILCRDELEALQYLHPSFKVFYTLDKPPSKWKGGEGFVSEEMVREHLPSAKDDCLILVCGPKGLMDSVSGNKASRTEQGEVSGICKKLGFTKEQVYKF